MAVSRDKVLSLARVYAQALLAAGAGREGELAEELAGVVELLDRDPGLEAVLANPLIDTEGKRALIERALRGRASDVLVDGLQVMRRKRRLDLLRAVAAEAHELWLAREGRIEVKVASAVPLSAAQRQALEAAAAARTGKRPTLVESVDPALLGGLVVQIGDEKVDATVTAELARVRGDLLDRAARELHSDKSYVTNTHGSERLRGA